MTQLPPPPVLVPRGRIGLADWLDAYTQLTKARLSLLVLWTTAVGFLLAATTAGGGSLSVFLWTLLGTALSAAAANMFNQVIEIERDAAMLRTAARPLPAGVVGPRHVTIVAGVFAIAGPGLLLVFVNAAAAMLAALTIGLYVLVYTPLKTRSTLNTLVGAVCGALPPMIGWVAATGRLEAGAWALAAILFVWQIPHFLALAWLYRVDYARGRFRMLPVFDRDGRVTGQIVVLTSLMLVPVALTATLIGLGGWIYTIGSILLGGWMVTRAVGLYRDRSEANARRVFLASLLYLAVLLVLLVIDQGTLTWAEPTVYRLVAAGP
ncbi:MAG: protoheme IX farnesyltransferase [Phycisphaerales bacterium]|nr:heme o synthase [Phycisphaerae bacterium]NNF41872.1 protoheme IX farnesyltransferase [Phycisphaerales bacterium]NNM25312.1 protoheme IX farnesyltransferase [Phycisphaerales bacterium]